MNSLKAWGMSAAIAAVLLFTGCAPAAPAGGVTESPDGSAAPETEPTTAAPAESADAATSDYAPCPDGLLDTLNSTSSGSTTWEEGAWADDLVGQAIDAPVPSCTVVRGSDWTQSFYVGGDQALWDQLAASIVALGLPESPSESPVAGQKGWGTADTGYVTLQTITPGDAMTILGPAFTEPSVVLEVLGEPLP